MPPNKRKRVTLRTPEPDNRNLDPEAYKRVEQSKGEWDTPTRVRVKTLHEAGFSRTTIKQRTNVPIRTQQSQALQDYRRPGKNRPGAAQVLTPKDLRAIVRYIKKSFKIRQITFQQLAHDYGHGCHPDTIKRALTNEGIHKCRVCQMTWLSDDNVANRLAFAKQHKSRSTTF